MRPTAEAGQRSKRTSPIQPCACPGWAAARIEERHYDLLASFSERLVVEIKGIGEVLFCHATPRGDEEILTAATPDDWLREILYEVDQDQIVCGHLHILHIQYDRRLDGNRVINACSVGMPYQSESVGAFWLLLDRNVKFRRSRYDLRRAVGAFRATGYLATGDIAEILLEPPDSEWVADFFERQVGRD